MNIRVLQYTVPATTVLVLALALYINQKTNCVSVQFQAIVLLGGEYATISN